MKVNNNFKTMLQAETFTEFCFIRDLLGIAGIRMLIDDDSKQEKPKTAYFETDFDELRVFVCNLTEEDVQIFSRFTEVLSVANRYKVEFK